MARKTKQQPHRPTMADLEQLVAQEAAQPVQKARKSKNNTIATGTSDNRKTRLRQRYLFWLDLADDAQYAIAEIIDTSKSRRQFAKLVRDGIRLVNDLRAGRLDVLFELFPWVQAEFLKYMESLQPKQNNDDLIARLEALMLERGYRPERAERELPQRPELPRQLETLPEVEYDGNASENFLDAFL